MSVDVNLSGFDKVVGKLNNLSSNLEEIVVKESRLIAQEIKKDAEYLVPVDTGILRESIFDNVFKEGGNIVGEVGSNLEYAGYVEFGTGPVGQSAGLVRDGIDLTYRQTPWVYKDEDGNWHYTSGMKPQPYLYPAMKQKEDEITDRFGSAIVMELK